MCCEEASTGPGIFSHPQKAPVTQGSLCTHCTCNRLNAPGKAACYRSASPESETASPRCHPAPPTPCCGSTHGPWPTGPHPVPPQPRPGRYPHVPVHYAQRFTGKALAVLPDPVGVDCGDLARCRSRHLGEHRQRNVEVVVRMRTPGQPQSLHICATRTEPCKVQKCGSASGISTACDWIA